MPAGVPRPYNPRKQAVVNAIMEDMTIGFREEDQDKPCVYKLHYTNKYLIIKGKTLGMSLFHFKKSYAYYIGYEHGEGGKTADTLYRSFYEHIRRNPGAIFTVEVICFGSPYQLLKAEQKALDAALKDKACQNSNIEAYMPKWRPQHGSYGGWIPKSAYLNFRKFMKRRNVL